MLFWQNTQAATPASIRQHNQTMQRMTMLSNQQHLRMQQQHRIMNRMMMNRHQMSVYQETELKLYKLNRKIEKLNYRKDLNQYKLGKKQKKLLSIQQAPKQNNIKKLNRLDKSKTNFQAKIETLEEKISTHTKEQEKLKINLTKLRTEAEQRKKEKEAKGKH